MPAAQRQQAIDPAEVGIELEQRESGTGFSGVVHDVIARIGVWLYEMRAGSPAPRRPRVARTSFGGALLRIIVVLVLVGGIAGGALAWQYPRSEAVRMLVAEYAPQRVIDLMPAVDVQDSADASSELRTTVGNTGSPFQQVPGMDNGEANGNLSPMDQQQTIQKLARDVENLQQSIDQLRAGQDQMLRMMLRTPAPAAQARAQVVPQRPATATTGLAAGGLPGLAPNPQPRRPATPPPARGFYQ